MSLYWLLVSGLVGFGLVVGLFDGYVCCFISWWVCFAVYELLAVVGVGGIW